MNGNVPEADGCLELFAEILIKHSEFTQLPEGFSHG